MEEFRERIQEMKCDIAGITETWADEEMVDAELAVKGFDMFRVDRRGRKGGGVLLYIREQLKAMLLDAPSGFEEQVWCRIKLKSTDLVLGLCYRSPTSSAVNNGLLLEALDKTIGNKGAQHVMIMGDFNYPAIDFVECRVNSGEGTDDSRFYSRIQKLFLVQNVTEPTRIRGGQEPSVLDYVITDEENLVEDLSYEVPMGKSDHVCLTWKLKLEREELRSGSQEKLDYYKGNYEEISAALRAVDWEQRMGEGEDLDKMWMCFKETVMGLVDKWIPRRKIIKKTGREAKWMTGETKKLIKQRNKLWRVQKNYSSDINYNKYKLVRNRVTELVRRDQSNYRQDAQYPVTMAPPQM